MDDYEMMLLEKLASAWNEEEVRIYKTLLEEYQEQKYERS